MNKPLFGTAGTSESFKTMGYKSSAQVPEYTAAMGLDAFEYQCGRGVRLGQELAKTIRAGAEARGICFSLHAPYYISMSSMEEEKRLNSVNYILQSAAAVRALGGRRVIFHAGSCGKQSREEALEKALDTMARMQAALDEAGFEDITLCPETMGKVGQLGTLDEVLALCKVDKRITPCIDFGHLYARSLGADDGAEAFGRMLDRVESVLGQSRASVFHSHFSHIQFTPGGGEKCHRTFDDDDGYGPDWAPLARAIARRGWSPTFICESAGTQAKDALTMKRIYQEVLTAQG